MVDYATVIPEIDEQVSEIHFTVWTEHWSLTETGKSVEELITYLKDDAFGISD